MAIFTSNEVLNENLELPAVEGILPTMEASDQILYEFAEDMYKINAALYVSDVIIEQSVTEGAEKPEALMENVVTDFFKKIVDAFKKLWAKIKGWFKSIEYNLAKLFLPGEAFAKKYAGVILNKKDMGYEYEGYVYPWYSKLADRIITKAQVWSSPNSDEMLKHEAVATNTKDEWIELICDGKNIQDTKDAIIKEWHGNADNEHTIKDFSGNTKQDMLGFVGNYKERQKRLKESQKKQDKFFTDIIKTYENKEKGIQDTEENAEILKLYRNMSTNLQTSVSVVQQIHAIEIEMIKEKYKCFLGALKGYLVYKPAKESAVETGTDTKSILESAMNLI